MSKPEPLATPPSHEELRLQRLRALYPELDTEGGRVDPQRLAGLVPGDSLDPGPERYGLSWNGKRAAQQALALGPTGTLRPCPEESLDWETTRNVFIEGENLESLRILLKPYFRKVKMIYIDPPYNTGGDFIYKDNYAAPVADYLLVSNPESSGRYHSDWLTMMYPRLALARELLREDGVLFCSIDDHEVHNLRLLLNEVFGEENFVASVVWEKLHSRKNAAPFFSEKHDYVLCYARRKPQKPGSDIVGWRRYLLPREDTEAYGNPDADPKGDWKADPVYANNPYDADYEIVKPNGVRLGPPEGHYWRYSPDTWEEYVSEGRVLWREGDSYPMVKRYLSEVQDGLVPETLFDRAFAGDNSQANSELKSLFGGRVMEYTKPSRLIYRLAQVAMGDDSGALVVDFFAGSATTAHSIMRLNRERNLQHHYIMVQLPEVLDPSDAPAKVALTLGLQTIADIGKERIRRVAARIREEREGKLDLEQRETPLDLGMRVFKLGASSLAGNGHQATTEGRPDQDGDYVAALQGSLDTLLPDWRPEDLLWEVLLREGLPLDCRIETLTAGPQTVYRATDPDTDGDGAERRLYVCLDDAVSDEPLVALLGEDRNARLVCRESALADDSVAQNLALHCRLVTL